MADELTKFPERRKHVKQLNADDFHLPDKREMFLRIVECTDIEGLRDIAASYLLISDRQSEEIDRLKAEAEDL